MVVLLEMINIKKWFSIYARKTRHVNRYSPNT